MRSTLCFGFCGAVSFLILSACSAEGFNDATAGWDRDASAPLATAATVENEPTLEEAIHSCYAQAPYVADNDQAPQEGAPDDALPESACPDEMVLVQGNHCTKVKQVCADYMEDPNVNPRARCRRFEPSVCKGERVAMRYCVDRLEAAGDDGLPLADKSWTQAKQMCETQGKRLCTETEWTFACEGEEALPYPYGLVRDSSLCNFELIDDLVTLKGDLWDHRQPVTANPKCLSPFGVQNMVGNIDEWVKLDRPHFSSKNLGKKMNSGLKGGWWGPLRNRCRPTTVDHDEVFHELQTGFRCCKDAT